MRIAESEQPQLWERFQKLHPRHRDVRIREDRLNGLYALTSPDGLEWQRHPDPLLIHFGDTDTSFYYNHCLECYVMYTRLYNQERRWIGRAETEDFWNWQPVQPLIWPNLNSSISEDIYTNARCTYPGLPEYHLMFPMFYERFTQRSHIRMYSSHDGMVWNEVPGSPVITPEMIGDGIEFMGGRGDLVPFQDGVGLKVGGTPYPHKYPRWSHVLESHKSAWPAGRKVGSVR